MDLALSVDLEFGLDPELGYVPSQAGHVGRGVAELA
jgi:hypothetical protein